MPGTHVTACACCKEIMQVGQDATNLVLLATAQFSSCLDQVADIWIEWEG